MGTAETGGRTKYFKWGVGVGLVGIGFVSGWIAQTKMRFLGETVVEASAVSKHGDASASTREQVLESMREFQAGYMDRDVRRIDPFMQRLFPSKGEVLLLGTESSEWIHGYNEVKNVIRHDWTDWNDVRLDLMNCQISSTGDVAWIATRGEVSSSTARRPLRFSGTMVREDGVWKFRQLQFQYADRFVSLRDFLEPEHYSQIRWN